MEHLIDKDTLVADIERRLDDYKDDYKHRGDIYTSVLIEEVGDILFFINTLEVKEVDSLTPEVIKKICTIYDNLKQERECATVLYNSDETFFNHVLMEYKSIAQKGE